MGSLYKQAGSRIWWVKYHVHGRPVRESTGTADEQEARRILKTREGHAASGQPLMPRLDRIRATRRCWWTWASTTRRRGRGISGSFAGGSSTSIASSPAGTSPLRGGASSEGRGRRHDPPRAGDADEDAPARLPERQARAATVLSQAEGGGTARGGSSSGRNTRPCAGTSSRICRSRSRSRTPSGDACRARC